MQAALLASWTLFFGIFLFMAGNGLQLVLLGTQAEVIGFGESVTGLVMGGYFVGFLVGSRLVPKLLARVGHVRVFGALAALASSTILVHAVTDFAAVWFLMRMVTGFAYSGMYITAESWINDKATNKTRGALLSVYMMVTMTGIILGQLLIVLASSHDFASFLIVSVLISVSVLPILITAAPVPEFSEPERVSLAKVFHVSPLAVLGMSFNGLSTSVIFAMGAVYATKAGMTIEWVGFFMASIMFGALVLQYPVGWLSDRFDRRTVILAVQVLSTLAALFGWFSESLGFTWVVFAGFLFGGLLMPTYSLYIAHANDFLTPRQIVGTSSMLVMLNGFGALFGAPLAGYGMQLYGHSVFFPLLGVMQVTMTGIVVLRMMSRPSVPAEAQAPFVAMPTRSSGVATTLLPDAEWTGDDGQADTGADTGDEDEENEKTGIWGL